ncbi:MAG: hypothetical protein ABJI96_05285 [Paracoccaceae bacterium]
MTNDPTLIVAVTAGIAVLIGSVSMYFGAKRLLKLLFALWAILSVVLMVLAVLGMPFDREVFVVLWIYFALPAICGGLVGVWLIRRLSKKELT